MKRVVATLTNGMLVELACTQSFLERVAVDPPALERALAEIDEDAWTLLADGGYVRTCLIAMARLHDDEGKPAAPPANPSNRLTRPG